MRKVDKKPLLQNISQSVNKNDSSSMFEIGAKSYRTEVKGQKPIFQNCANIRSLIEIQKIVVANMR